MKIQRLEITMEPSFDWDDVSQFRVRVTTGSGRFETVEQFHNDHFTSIFDIMMDNAKRRIKEATKLQNK
jgi:hypothetical protein